MFCDGCGTELEERKCQIYDDGILILVIYYRCSECGNLFNTQVGFVKPTQH